MRMGSPDDSAADCARPIAGGLPISEAIAEQAAQWLTIFMSGEATDQDRDRWRRWREAQPDHERAWRHIEAVTGRLKVMQPAAAYKALSPYAGPQALGSPVRRKVLRMLLLVGGPATVGALASRTQSWQQAVADHRTGTGERRNVSLEDGSVITLNTATAVNVRFDGHRRVVRLVAGEMLIVTGHAADGLTADTRPFIVETAEGQLRTLGTRFAVRQRHGHTTVSVLESAVEITLRDAGERRILQAGEETSFTRASIGAPQAASPQATAWARGQIVADDMRLDGFTAELSRYRPGIMRCAPDVAGLRLSGVFPLKDIDRILATLPSVLPVQVVLRTRYWVTVEASAN